MTDYVYRKSQSIQKPKQNTRTIQQQVKIPAYHQDHLAPDLALAAPFRMLQNSAVYSSQHKNGKQKKKQDKTIQYNDKVCIAPW